MLFSTMTRMLDVVEELLDWRGYPFLRLDGGTAAAGEPGLTHGRYWLEGRYKPFLSRLSQRARERELSHRQEHKRIVNSERTKGLTTGAGCTSADFPRGKGES